MSGRCQFRTRPLSSDGCRYPVHIPVASRTRQTAAIDDAVVDGRRSHRTVTTAAHLDECVIEAATEEAVAEWIAGRVGEAEPLDERVDVHGDEDGARTIAVQVEVDVYDVVRKPGDGERRHHGYQQTDAASSTADQSPRVLLSHRPLAVSHDVAAPPEDAGDLHVGGRHREQRHHVQHDEHRHVV